MSKINPDTTGRYLASVVAVAALYGLLRHDGFDHHWQQLAWSVGATTFTFIVGHMFGYDTGKKRATLKLTIQPPSDRKLTPDDVKTAIQAAYAEMRHRRGH